MDAAKQMEAIMKKMKTDIDKQAEIPLRGSLTSVLRAMYAELSGYSPLTGNTDNSLAVGLFYDGKLMGYANVQDMGGVKRPTRQTLKSGDIYDLPFTWKGSHLSTPIGGKNPKRDWVGTRNFWADEEAVRFLQNLATNKKGYSYVFASAVDYAKYLESKGKANVLTHWHDELAAAGAFVGDMKN